MKREPILFIRGSEERAEEIRHILEDEWGGSNIGEYKYNDYSSAYYISPFGIVNNVFIKDDCFKKAVANGWLKEFILPEQPRFKPFDKVVVRIFRAKWFADIYSHEDEDCINFVGHSSPNKDTIVLPYNDETAKLIGTNDEWEGGAE